MIRRGGRAVPAGAGPVALLAVPGVMWFALAAWTGLGLPFPDVVVSVGAGHTMAPLDWVPRKSLRSDSLSSGLFILLALVGLGTGLITSRRQTKFPLASIAASALVVAVYLLILAWEKWWSSATFRMSVLAIDDSEYQPDEFFHAAIVFYAFAAAIWLSSIWAGVGLAELLRAAARRRARNVALPHIVS